MKIIRLTNKGKTLIFFIAMVVAFTTGFTVWKITGLPNLAATYSEAGGGNVCRFDRCDSCTRNGYGTGSECCVPNGQIRYKCPDGTWICGDPPQNCSGHEGPDDDPEPMEGACLPDGSNRCSNADPKCGTFCVNLAWGTCNQAMVAKGCTIPGGSTLPIVSGLQCVGCPDKETSGCGTGYNGTLVSVSSSHYNASTHSINCSGYCGSIQCDGKDANGNDSYTDKVCTCDDPPTTEKTPPVCESFSLNVTHTTDLENMPTFGAPSKTLFDVKDNIQVTATAKDPDGNPEKIYLCTSLKGQSQAFYEDVTHWKCYERSSQKTISLSKTYETYRSEYLSATSGVTEAQVDENGLIVITTIEDNATNAADSTTCTAHPAVTTVDNFVPVYSDGTSCGTVACGGSVTLQDVTEPYCGDGIYQPEIDGDCDYNDSTNSGACSSSICSSECTCPNPGLNINKTGADVCIEGDSTYADITYKITVANTGEDSGHISQIVDNLDDKVQDGWIVPTSVTPTAGSTINGNTITWDLEIAAQEFSPGEEMVFSYVVRVPESSFGSFTNVATAIVTDEGEDNITATATVEVDCEVLPDNGLFDSTMGRIVLAAMLLVAGAYYAQSESIDKLLFNSFTASGRIDKKRKRFEKRNN